MPRPVIRPAPRHPCWPNTPRPAAGSGLVRRVSPVSFRSEQDRRAGSSLEEFQRDLADNLCYERGTTVESASAQDAYWTLAVTIRDRLAERRARTARANY